MNPKKQSLEFLMSQRLSIRDLSLKNQKVLMRVDFNVPLDKSATVKDDTRIKEALPSINYVLDHGGSVILMSHLGRPKGKDPKDSLEPVAKRLVELLQKPVLFAKDCMDAKEMADSLNPGDILLLENLRFYPAEEKPASDPNFAKILASYGTLYVDDAFGSVHRAHSSITEVPKYFPGKTAAGFLLEKELQFLEKLLEDPERPFIAIIGGAKVSSKIGVLKSLLEEVDALLIGGAMAYTFMKAQGVGIGRSLYEEGFENEAKEILKDAKERGIKLLLPLDHVVAESSDNPKEIKVVQGAIPEGFFGVDIGPKTVAMFKKEIQKAKTVFWNGPLGIFEKTEFSEGTIKIAHAVAESSCISVIGGGDSVSAVHDAGVEGQITHISTGGGATLEYLENGTLPGIEALDTRELKTS